VALIAAFAGRNSYVAALAIAAGAIAGQLISKQYAGLRMRSMARSAQALKDTKEYASTGRDASANAQADESVRLKGVASRCARQADLWGSVSLILALLAAVYSVSARLHREAGGQGLLLALLAVDLLLLLIVV
jgi:hypothetical protein